MIKTKVGKQPKSIYGGHEPEDYAAAMMAVIDGKTERPAQNVATVGDTFYQLEQFADQEILDSLSAVGDTIEKMAWEAGWLTEDLYRNLLANGFQVNGRPVDYLFVCHYVSIKKLRGQRQMNSIKKYGLTARFFPRPIAKKFHFDVLPMSHFVLAASYDDLPHPSGEKMWKAILERSWDSYQNSPMSRHISEADLKDWAEGRTPKARTAKSVDTIPSMTPVTGYSASEEEEYVTPEIRRQEPDLNIVVNILGGIAQNFVLGAQAYVPALAQRRPYLAKGLAKLLEEMKDFVTALNTPEEE